MKLNEWQTDGSVWFRCRPDGVRAAAFDGKAQYLAANGWQIGPSFEASKLGLEWCDAKLLSAGYELEDAAQRRALNTLISSRMAAASTNLSKTFTDLLADAKRMDQFCRAMPGDYIKVKWRCNKSYNGTICAKTEKAAFDCIDAVLSKHQYNDHYDIDAFSDSFHRMTLGDIKKAISDELDEISKATNSCVADVMSRLVTESGSSANSVLQKYFQPCSCSGEGCSRCNYVRYIPNKPVEVSLSEGEFESNLEKLKPYIIMTDELSGKTELPMPELSAKITDYISEQARAKSADRSMAVALSQSAHSINRKIWEATYLKLAGVSDEDISSVLGINLIDA